MNFIKSTVTFLSCILTCYVLNIANTTMATSPAAVSIQRSSDERPVKLSMKQGLIMNQIVATYTLSDPRNVLCRNHTQIYKAGLRALQPWALQMFDSSSKLQSSILMGNLIEYGAFKQCLNIYKTTSDNGDIRGKHCSLRIKPSVELQKVVLSFRNVSAKRFALLKSSVVQGVRLVWSVCVPSSCPAADVHQHFNKMIMELSEGLELNVTLTEKDCETLATMPQWTSKEIVLLISGAALVLLVVAGTIMDFTGGNESNQFCRIFSAISNGRRLISRGASQMDCLHGIRFLSTCYVMFGHRFMTGMLFPSVNSLYLIEWILKYTSTVIIGGTVCVDTFLFLSATLVSYHCFIQLETGAKFSLIRFYLYRYLRITPPLAVAVLFYALLIQHLGSGPLWRDTYTAMQKPCQFFWWSTLLHIQNYVNPQFLCIPQTWYLSCEMIYYYLSPIIMYPLWKWPVIGYANLMFFYAVSIGSNFYLAWINRYVGGMPLTQQLFETQYFQRHYIAPHVRAAPYIIGLGFGYALFRTRGRKIEMNLLVIGAGWLAALIFMSAAVAGSHVFQEENHDYNRLESSLFLSCSRSAWVSGIAWIIWVCVHGYGGFVNRILSLHVFRVLGRISYGIFLFHMSLQFLKDGAAKVPAYYSDFHMLFNCGGDLVVMLAIGAIFAICFEYPCMGVAAALLQRKNRNKIHQEAKQ